ncbi:hypothetical protein ABK040_010107 [Willaertia magna]
MEDKRRRDLSTFKEKLKQRHDELDRDVKHSIKLSDVKLINNKETDKSKKIDKYSLEREKLLKEAQALLEEDVFNISKFENEIGLFEDVLPEEEISQIDNPFIDLVKSSIPEKIVDEGTPVKELLVNPNPANNTHTKYLNNDTVTTLDKSVVLQKQLQKLNESHNINPFEIEKQQIVEEKVEDVQSQIKKVENAISASEQKEMEIKRGKQKQVEEEKAKIKEITSEIEKLNSDIEFLKSEQESCSKQLQIEKKKMNDFTQNYEIKKSNLQRELERLLFKFSEDSGVRNSSKELFNKAIEDAKTKLEDIVNSIGEVEQEMKEKENSLKELQDDEEEWMKQLNENIVIPNSDLSETVIQNVVSLLKRETEICMRIERLKEKFPLEMFLVELQQNFEKTAEELEKKRRDIVSNVENIKVEIEKKRKDLISLERENEIFQMSYAEEKSKHEAYLTIEKRKIISLQNFMKFKNVEIEETTKLLSEAKTISEKTSLENTITNSLFYLENQILNELIEQKEKSLCDKENLSEEENQLQLFKQQLITTFKQLFIEKSSDVISKCNKDEEERNIFIEQLSSKIGIEKERVEMTLKEVEDTKIEEREKEYLLRKESERIRLTEYAQKISEIEQEINGLIKERNNMETELSSNIEGWKAVEEKFIEEKQDLERQLANKYKNSSDDELKDLEERFARCEKLVGTLFQIKDVISQYANREQHDQITKAIETQNNVEAQVREIQKKKEEYQSLLKVCVDRLAFLTKEKDQLEFQCQDLLMEDIHMNKVKEKEIKQLQNRKIEIESILEMANEDLKVKTKECQEKIRPLEQILERNDLEIQKLSKILHRKKKELITVKKVVEEIEAVYTAKISQIRAQKQCLKHRLELKLQALSNIKKSDDTMSTAILTRSTTPKYGRNSQIMSNNKPSKASDNTVSNSYFKMYIKKKEPNIENLGFDNYDQELYDALLSDQNKVSTSISIPNHTNPIIPIYEDEIRIETKKNEIKDKVDKKGALSPSLNPLAQNNMYKLFGPNSKPLSEQDAQFVIDKIQFLCRGTLLHKKKTQNSYVVRHISLSTEFTRLLIRDKKKKVPESFIKIEHIQQVVPHVYHNALVSGAGTQVKSSMQGAFSFSLMLGTNKTEFLTFDENDFNNWIDGINILIDNKENLFSLRYNVKDLIML